MKLALMQPYFFPYLGYFELIQLVDVWVVFDTVKYTPQSWMTRNRLLHPDGGWQYIRVPVKRPGAGEMLEDIALVDAPDALRRMVRQIDHYRARGAPFFGPVRELIERTFAHAPSGLLVDLCLAGLVETCAYLGMPFEPRRLSQMGLRLPPISHAGGWGPEISSVLGADVYINAPGGRDLFQPGEFTARGIELLFLEPDVFRYATPGYDFVENLSIIDVLMWNAPEAVRDRLARAAVRS